MENTEVKVVGCGVKWRIRGRPKNPSPQQGV